jgi:hypothetical protein
LLDAGRIRKEDLDGSENVTVKTPSQTTTFMSKRLLGGAGALAERRASSTSVVVTDRNVDALYGQRLEHGADEANTVLSVRF